MQEALKASRVGELAEPTLAPGESLSDLASDDFDPDAVGARGYGFVRLAQLALEHLLGAR